MNARHYLHLTDDTDPEHLKTIILAGIALVIAVGLGALLALLMP